MPDQSIGVTSVDAQCVDVFLVRFPRRLSLPATLRRVWPRCHGTRDRKHRCGLLRQVWPAFWRGLSSPLWCDSPCRPSRLARSTFATSSASASSSRCWVSRPARASMIVRYRADPPQPFAGTGMQVTHQPRMHCKTQASDLSPGCTRRRCSHRSGPGEPSLKDSMATALK